MRRAKTGAGAYEQQRYDEGLRAFRRRVLPTLRWFTFPIVAVSVLYYAYGPVSRLQWVVGLVAGAALTLYLWVRDDPPAHVQHHGKGAEGERATEKVLRLLPQGWHVAHNVETRRGNRDHIVVGPPGVFLLDSKKLGGIVTVEDDVVRVERVDDDRDTYNLPRLASALRADAARLHDELQVATGVNTWVTALVVFWSRFDARAIEGKQITFLHGEALIEWLRARPVKYSDAQQINRLAEAVQRASAEGASGPADKLTQSFQEAS